jgi:hypothetical protein
VTRLKILRKELPLEAMVGVGLGKIAISLNHSISNVYLVESLDYNLLSVSQCEMGYNCLFTNEGVTVLEGAMTPLLLRVDSREDFIWWIFHQKKPNLIHAYCQSLAWVGFGITG